MLFTADPKTKAVIHYIISHAAPDRLGATKLNKVMWRADIRHYRQFGSAITGQTSYIRMPQGPVPNFAKESIEELKAEGRILERAVDTAVGNRREFVWIEKASPGLFTREQVEILQESIRMICRKPAVQASEETHDALWQEIENGDQIPIGAASVLIGQLDPSELNWALALAKQTA